MAITYLGNFEDLEIIDNPLWWHKQGRQQTASGYGSKLVTPHMVKHNGRLYRIYCRQYSNAGSFYIVSQGKELYIR